MEPLDFICSSCKHFDRINGGCKAFPDGIPDSINGGNDHKAKIKGQRGDYVFTRISA